MLHRIAAVLIVSSVLLTACGSRPVLVGRDGTIAAGGITVPPSDVGETPIDDPAASPFPTVTPRAVATTAPDGGNALGFGSGPGEHNTMPLQVTLSRSCVRPGEEMQATAVTLPASKLAFAAAYSDNSIVPDFTYTPAEANPTGTFTWTWVIRPTIPPGDALVSVVAAKDDRGASFEAPFRIARAC